MGGRIGEGPCKSNLRGEISVRFYHINKKDVIIYIMAFFFAKTLTIVNSVNIKFTLEL